MAYVKGSTLMNGKKALSVETSLLLPIIASCGPALIRNDDKEMVATP